MGREFLIGSTPTQHIDDVTLMAVVEPEPTAGTPPVSAVPVPAAGALLGAAFGVLALMRRREKPSA